MINSAAVDYSPWIKKGLEQNRVAVTISLDSGTRETYKKIKNSWYEGEYQKIKINIKTSIDIIGKGNIVEDRHFVAIVKRNMLESYFAGYTGKLFCILSAYFQYCTKASIKP